MAAVAFTVASTAFSVGSSLSAKSKAGKAKRQEQRMQRLMTSEELRRLDKEQAQVLGSARSQISASGFTGYGNTSEAYLNELQREQGLQKQFTATVGAQRAAAIGTRGAAQEKAYQSQAISSLLGGIGKVGESFNWGLDETT